MPNNARLTDQFSGICSIDGPVTGEIITASTDTFTNNLGQARVTDTVRASCGHTGQIITGSENTFVNGLKVARIGDEVGGGTISGTIITGSPNVITN